MTSDHSTNRNRPSPDVVHGAVSKAGIWAYVVALNLLYLLVRVHTPITVNAGAPHDDTLFMSLGQFLADGRWLGPYNQFTLMKGPGYPAFLAASNLLGTSASFTTALFHCVAATFFVAICHRFVKSLFLSGLLLFLLVWHPISLTVYLLRILRETIYYAQVLLLFAALIGALFYATGRRERALYAVLSGTVCGWFWLTREEGIWILPAVALLVAAAAIHAFSRGNLPQLTWTVVTIALVFAAPLVAFRAINWWSYGLFVGVDFKETNYQRALAALHGVRSGRLEPHISVTRETRQRIYAVSPSFASLKTYLDGPSSAGWVHFTCGFYPGSCGEIASGWFIFALRDAASVNGHYQTPMKASAFFGTMADEISTACARGGLECRPQLVSEMPQVTAEQVVTGAGARYLAALRMILLPSPPPQINPSTPDGALLDERLQFLNYPRYQRSPGAVVSTYSMSGWYFRAGGEWITVTARDASGRPAFVSAERKLSPDLVAGFRNPAMAHQRFTITVQCHDDCTLRLEAMNGAYVEKMLAEFRGGPFSFKVGEGDVRVDETRVHAPAASVVHRSDELFRRLRFFVLTYYHFVFVPVLAAGVIAFAVATLFYPKYAIWNVCYVLALVSWTLAFARVSLLILMEQTATLTVLNPFYGAPVFFMTASGAVLSIAAVVQLRRRDPARDRSMAACE